MKRLILVTLPVLLLALTVHAENGEGQYFDSDGAKIYYTVQGEGEPVVLIHGFTANQDVQWRNPGIIDALDDDYKVIAYDNRGHGKSDKPYGAENYGGKMVQDVINLLDHLDIDKAHVAGYSMGGFITLNLVANHPDRLITAAVTGAGWNPPGSEFETVGEEIAKALEEEGSLRPLMHALTPPGRDPMPEEQIKMIDQMLLTMNDPKALASVARGLKDLNVTEEALKKNKVPVLAIVGEIDPLKAGTDAMAAVMSNVVDVVVISGADHITAFNYPEFAEALKGFIDADGMLEAAGAKEAAADTD